MIVNFTVLGVPAPQGSKVRTKWGVREDNPRTKPWRQDVAAEALEAMGGNPPMTGPVAIDAVFYFPRPKAHYGTGRNAGIVKESAPDSHTSKPDVDKLLRAIGDAMSGIVYRDDSQVSYVRARKEYAETPRVLIQVWEEEPA